MEERAKSSAKPYRPPVLNQAQLEQIQHGKKKGRTLIMDWDDDEEQKTEEDPDEERIYDEEEEEKEESRAPSTSFMAKMQELMKEPTPPVDSPIPSEAGSVKHASQPEMADVRDGSAGGMAAPKPPGSAAEEKVGAFAPPKPQRKPVQREMLPRKPIQKLVSAAPPRETKIPTPREPTPPPPPTPLPEFISQFIGLEWFDKYFPNCNSNTMPKPWSVVAFVTMLLRVLRIAEYPQKVQVVEALRMLQRDEGIPNADAVHRSLLGILSHHAAPPTCLNQDQKAFILDSVNLLSLLGVCDKDFYVELMTQFMEGDKEVRSMVLDILKGSGLKDPHNYLSKELDSWDVWNLEDKERAGEIRKMCQAWLDKWMTSFKIHIEDSIERLKRGQGVHGRATPNQLRRSSPQKASSRHRPSLGGALPEEGEAPMGEGVQHFPAPGEGPAHVAFETAPSATAIDNATYMEAFNYFVEMELEKYLDRMRAGGAGAQPGSKGTQEGNVKNTVLVLPKMNGTPTLVRLGETHTSKRRGDRTGQISLEFKLPPITNRGHQPPPGELFGFPNAINMPMPTLYYGGPFQKSADDDYEQYAQQPVLITLKTAQKYFVPGRSYVPQDTY